MSQPSVPVDAIAYAVATDLAAVRDFVRTRGLALGLPPNRVDLLLLAVSELATNTLLHTSGGGHVRVWAEPDHVICDVVDGGRLATVERSMPAAHAVRGRGLAIVGLVCDDVTTEAVDAGTLVRLRLKR